MHLGRDGGERKINSGVREEQWISWKLQSPFFLNDLTKL